MAKHLSSIHVECYRGIRELNLKNLSHINLILGDNNSGKTSLLEAISLFRRPLDLSNLFYIARSRAVSNYRFQEPLFNSFLSLYSNCKNSSKIHVDAVNNGARLGFTAAGEIYNIVFDPASAPKLLRLRRLPTEYQEFRGILSFSQESDKKTKTFSLGQYDNLSIHRSSRSSFMNVEYLSSIDHLNGGHVSTIVQNDSFKKISINLLKELDPDIEDLLLIEDETLGSIIECIRHSDSGLMPISSYGDGIKKILSIVAGITKARNGILLIDEIETAVHKQHYPLLFSLLIHAALRLNIQVFITSHSLEILDSLIDSLDYSDTESVDDKLTVATLKKTRNSTLARVLPGRIVKESRDLFEFEARI